MSDDEYILRSRYRAGTDWTIPPSVTADLRTHERAIEDLYTQLSHIRRQAARERTITAGGRNLEERLFSELMSEGMPELRRAAPPQVTAPVPEPDNWIPTGGPTVTLVPVLPKTTYKDQDEIKGADKTDSYLNVQRATVEYLRARAADTLTPHQARKWTEALDPTENNEPTAQEALRLCYYMRSLGYDTYSHIDKKEMINLYVVNPRIVNQSAVYWQQNFTTNASTPTEARPHAARRNAVVAQELPGSTQPAPGEPEAIRILRRRLRQAGAAVEREMTRLDQRPDAIMAAIENQTTIQVQLDTAVAAMGDARIVADHAQQPAEETIVMDTT